MSRRGIVIAALAFGAALCAASPARAQAPAAPAPTADPRIQALVAAISVDRLKALDTTLVGFGTRNTLSDATGISSVSVACCRRYRLIPSLGGSARIPARCCHAINAG